MTRLLLATNLEVEDQVERDLTRAVARCRAFYGKALAGLYLGGGYGRGEGGLRRVGAGWAPENDYDLFALVRGGGLEARLWRQRTARRLIPALQQGQPMEYEVGVLGVRSLARQVPTQMLHDLRQGHLCLWGDPEALLELPCDDPAELPPSEGLRLLVNRGALLLLAAQGVAAGAPLPPVRLDRFLHKARLAVGDGWLLLNREHHHLLSVRATRVAESPLPGLPRASRWRDLHSHAATARLAGFPPPARPSALLAQLRTLLPHYGEALEAGLELCERRNRRWLRLRPDAFDLARRLVEELGQEQDLVAVGQRAEGFLGCWRAAA
jgi:hypothetical protein